MISSVSMSREMNRMIAAFTNRENSNTAFDKALQSSESESVFTSRDKPRLGTITKDNYPGKWDLLDIDFEEQLGFKYSKAKSNPTDLEVNWSVPSCMGPQLLGSIFDDRFQELFHAYPQEYAQLMEKRSERCKAVSEEYGLDGLSSEEFYYKTQGEKSKEMTDFFYNGFDDEGERLISLFFPNLAKKFGF